MFLKLFKNKSISKLKVNKCRYCEIQGHCYLMRNQKIQTLKCLKNIY